MTDEDALVTLPPGWAGCHPQRRSRLPTLPCSQCGADVVISDFSPPCLLSRAAAAAAAIAGLVRRRSPASRPSLSVCPGLQKGEGEELGRSHSVQEALAAGGPSLGIGGGSWRASAVGGCPAWGRGTPL